MNKTLDAKMMASYMAANGFGVLSVDEPDGTSGQPYFEHDPHVVVLANGISVLVYQSLGNAQVVLRGTLESEAKILDPVDTYIKAVAGVKSLLPPRPKTIRGPLA